MRALGDFVDRLAESATPGRAGKPSRIGVVATAGDRRDEDMRELGAVAAEHFDAIMVREDAALRGRERGEIAARWPRACGPDGRGGPLPQVEIVLDELERCGTP